MVKVEELPLDEIRRKLLEYLWGVRQKARSLGSVEQTISEIKRGVKPLGVNQNQVVQGLDYLIQHEWVEERVEHRTFKSPKGFDLPSEKRTYKLTQLGINFFEGPSQFSTLSRFAGVNISNVGGVIVLGDNNIVRTEFRDMFSKIEQLENQIKISGELAEDKKLLALADTQTIKDQLIKPVPDKNIVKSALASLQFLALVPGLVDFVDLVKKSIESIL